MGGAERESDQGILDGEDPGVSLPSAVFSGPGCEDMRLCLRPGTGDLGTRGRGHKGAYRRISHNCVYHLMNTDELAVDSMCSEAMPALYASSVKTGLSPMLSRGELPTSLSLCSQGQATVCACLLGTVHGNLEGHLYFNLGLSNRLRHVLPVDPAKLQHHFRT